MKKTLKFLFTGKDGIELFDKFIFKITNKKHSGWELGNKSRAFFYGRKKSVSHEPLIFIGGFPRSGTSLLKVMLEQHKDIASPSGEVNVFQTILNKKVLKDYFGFTNKEIKKLKLNKKKLIESNKKIIDLFKKKTKSKIVLLKQPKHILLINEIFKYYPNAKFIHLIRNGKNATMSQKYWDLPENKKNWPYSWCCRQWVVCINKGKKFSENKNYIEIKYEDLLKNPKKNIDKITDFINVKKISEKTLFKYRQNKGAKKYKNHPNIRKPLNKKNINKWEKKMSEKDKKTFEKIAGKTYRRIGYEKRI